MKHDATPYNLVTPDTNRVPMILSIPHCGTEFPDELKEHYHPELIKTLDDTDWNLDQLYDFAPDLGVTVIYAKYSRWVIDLNREPGSVPLYDDGRLITALCPTTDFLGNPIYREKQFEPDDGEINRRLEQYFYPYHRKIDTLIESLRSEFADVLFWDAHSIRRIVRTIRPDPFPDFILGNNDGQTADKRFSEAALSALGKSEQEVSYNEPFKGGYLTRSKGDPAKRVHALQLEMSKDLYMSNDETQYDKEKAKGVKSLLKSTFEKLISLL